MTNYPLKDLAEFMEHDGERIGMLIRCPNCGVPGSVQFEGTRWLATTKYAVWKRTGDTLETISLTPSVLMRDHFHSWVRNGELQVDSQFQCVKVPPETPA